MISIGYDIGSSSVKCTFMDIASGHVLASGSHPEREQVIDSVRPGWAEQDPAVWWEGCVFLTRKLMAEHRIAKDDIRSIGITYQMHGLVCVDEKLRVLRPSIIWCDSRAVDIGQHAFSGLGSAFCLEHLLNSPGNFTASKLRWVRENEPEVFGRIHKILLPGDYIAMKLTGETTTTLSGLTEGIFWDFKRNAVSRELLAHYEIEERLIPEALPSLSIQGSVLKEAARELGIAEGTPVAYRAGDQPNNAFSLNVLEPGEIAATAGTSGVVFAVGGSPQCDPQSRINAFAHVNHTPQHPRIGMLLCINGTGIAQSWIRRISGNSDVSYAEINRNALQSPAGANGATFIPFGNGAERMLCNRSPGAGLMHLDFNRQEQGDILRAVQEGVAFSFIKGIEIMKELDIHPAVLRAGSANMFLSPLFTEALATAGGVNIELYNTDGAQGAARGAAYGAGYYNSMTDAFAGLERVGIIEPSTAAEPAYRDAYARWSGSLDQLLGRIL